MNDNAHGTSKPIFQDIFGASWTDLPAVMKKHYANRPYSSDVTTVEGLLDVQCSGPIKYLAPLFWFMGGIPPHNEQQVPVTVTFESQQNNTCFYFNRIFNFKSRKSYCFKSRMVQTKNNEVIEIMRFGLGWKMSYAWQNNQVTLSHKGYVLHLFGYYIPLPLTFILGAGNAHETAIDDRTFDMSVAITHPWWGKIYQYQGRFKLIDKS